MYTLVASEIDIIEKCSEAIEKKAILEFMMLIMYYAETVDFEHICQWYSNWVRCIERGEQVWGDDPLQSGVGILDRAKCVSASSEKKSPSGSKAKVKPKASISMVVWWCNLSLRNKFS